MTGDRSGAIELIQRLPDDATLDDIIDALYFKLQVDRGLRDTVEGRVLSHEELKERIAKWRKSAVASRGREEAHPPRALGTRIAAIGCHQWCFS